jgi:hypothetical protein
VRSDYDINVLVLAHLQETLDEEQWREVERDVVRISFRGKKMRVSEANTSSLFHTPSER